MAKKDNGSRQVKTHVLKKLMDEIDITSILETNDGSGAMYNDLYRGFPGVVMEKSPKKTSALVKQRPNWAVYEGDSAKIISAGVGFHLSPNFIDIDPYGSPWDIIRAIFSRIDLLPNKFAIAVNDGLRANIKLDRAWKIKWLEPYVREYGNHNIYYRYNDIVYDELEKLSMGVGAKIEGFNIFQAGHTGQMTHYSFIVNRD